MLPYLRLARKYSRYDAEDLAQELSLVAWQMALKGFESRQIGHRLKDRARSWYRSECRRNGFFQPMPDGFDMPKDETNYLVRALLHAVVDSLPVGDQAICNAISEGKTFREISLETGISPASICRVIKKIKKQF